MAIKTVAPALPDTYFKLVKQFPLTRIRNGEHLADALKVIERLLAENLDKGKQAYLDTLTDLVEAYENEHVPIKDASEADVLRELMRVNGLSQPKLEKATGITQSTVSAVLNGKRPLTREQVVTLAKFFKVSTVAFMGG